MTNVLRKRMYDIEMPLRIEVLIRQHILSLKKYDNLDNEVALAILKKGYLFHCFN